MNITAIIAMTLIALLEAWAIYNGINGALLAGTIAIIAALGGYVSGKKRQSK